MLTLKLLKHFGACQEGIDFVFRNKLIGLSLSVIKDLNGNYGFLYWIKDYCNVITDSNGNVISYTDYNGKLHTGHTMTEIIRLVIQIMMVEQSHLFTRTMTMVN